jgi:hypothetical protein
MLEMRVLLIVEHEKERRGIEKVEGGRGARVCV